MSFNELSLIEVTSKYPAYAGKPYPMLAIDDVPLDIWMNQRFPSEQIEGLVPAQKQLYNEHDLCLAWRRIQPGDAGLSTIVPLLVCPDDMDLKCMVIVAEQLVGDDSVTWLRFGQSDDHYLDQVGATVKWFQTPCTAKFDKAIFESVLSDLERERLDQESEQNESQGSAVLTVSYLLECPQSLLKRADGYMSEAEALKFFLESLPERMGHLQLSPEIKLSVQSSQLQEINPESLNCENN